MAWNAQHKGQCTAGRLAMFISCDPPRVCQLSHGATSRTTSVGVNIALGMPGKISHFEGSKWLMDKLISGNSMICNPLSWVRCQSCVQLWAFFGRSLEPARPQKKSCPRPISESPLQLETKAQWRPLSLHGDCCGYRCMHVERRGLPCVLSIAIVG